MEKNVLIIGLLLLILTSCKNDDLDELTEAGVDDSGLILEEEAIDTPDWTDVTHSNDVDPNYEVVFPEDKVIKLEIKIESNHWALMQSDLDQNMSSGDRGQMDFDFTPVWVPATLTFEGKDWYQIGIRYKGNSTLRSAYNSNTDKFPFKLDFDEFEDTYPDIKNQRFYGFKQLNLSSNYNDASYMREKLASDLFRGFGVPAAESSFCAVYLDRGNGLNFIGMYTLIEEVDDTVYETQFDYNQGNLYKPDGDAASFANGSFNEEEFDLKTNEEEANYADVQALYDLLHNDQRTSDEEQWKVELESIFDVDGFLKYLAANNVIQNWDTYGVMTHNYFLYNYEGRLCWIPWDNNESFDDGKMGGAVSLSMNEVDSSWPLIRYIMDVEEYELQYRDYLRDFIATQFTSDQMNSIIDQHEGVLSEYSNVSSSAASLKSYIDERIDAAKSYLDQ